MSDYATIDNQNGNISTVAYDEPVVEPKVHSGCARYPTLSGDETVVRGWGTRTGNGKGNDRSRFLRNDNQQGNSRSNSKFPS